MSCKLSHEQFIVDCNKVHNNFYDYSNTTYTLAKNTILIECPIHGEFLQQAYRHRQGRGCRKCSQKQKTLRQTMSYKEFIRRATLVHHSAYLYPNQVYTNARTKLRIVCPTHGDFLQAPYSHLKGAGCRKCNNHSTIKSISEFVDAAVKLYGDKYEYTHLTPNLLYSEKQRFICKLHGEFYQTCYKHLKYSGCVKCRATSRRETRATTFLEKAKTVHKGTYKYTNVNYVNAITKVAITCTSHGDFLQTPNSHLNGVGCPTCGIDKLRCTGNTLLNKAKKYREANKTSLMLSNTYVYIMRFTTDTSDCYKVGVSKYPTKRFSKLLRNFSDGEIICTIELDSYHAYTLEAMIHDIYKAKRAFKDPPYTKFDGFTEMFNLSKSDVTNLIFMLNEYRGKHEETS